MIIPKSFQWIEFLSDFRHFYKCKVFWFPVGILSNWYHESKLDTQFVEIRNLKYSDNTCRYCVNTYRWGQFAIPTGVMKIPVGIGPSIDISIAGEDTLNVNRFSPNT